MGFTEVREKPAAITEDEPLQPHQERVRDRFLAGDDRLLLYHGLGSGKTRAALTAAEAAGEPYVAAVPAALRPSWHAERKRWTDQATPAEVLSQTALGRGAEPTVAPETLIVDELQRLRNPDTAQARATAALAARAKRLLLLSGTPIVNAPGDLAGPLNMLAGTHFTPKSFEDRFVGAEREPRGLLGWLRGDASRYHPAVAHAGELGRLLRGHVDYQPSRTPEGVTTHDTVVDVDLGKDQDQFNRLLYGKLPWLTRWKVRHQYPLSNADLHNLTAFFTGSREAGLSLRPFGSKADPLAAFEGSTKLRTAGEHLLARLKDPRRKALVYSNFPGAGLEPYDAFLASHKIPHATFRGGLSDEARRKAVADYNLGKLRVLLMGPAAAEGISTRGSSLIQLLDPAFNEARLSQARGRGLRFDSHEGLPADLKDVDVERYIAHGRRPGFFGRLLGSEALPTADEVLSRMAANKQELNERFLDVLRSVGSEKAAGGPGAVADLKKAKRYSDARHYSAKHRLLRSLLEKDPKDFRVDSRRGAFVGLTHASGFKIHYPARMLPEGVEDRSRKAAGTQLPLAVMLDAARRRRRPGGPGIRPRPATVRRLKEPAPDDILETLTAPRRGRQAKVAGWHAVPAQVAHRVKVGSFNPPQSGQGLLGGPNVLTNALVYGALGAGAGNLLGRAAEGVAGRFLPEGSVEEGKGRRVGTTLGALLGGLAWPAYRHSVAVRAEGGPAGGDWLKALTTQWPWRPEDMPEVRNKGSAELLAALVPDFEGPEEFRKAADRAGMGQTGALFTPSIPVDAFNNAVWMDVNSPPNPYGTRNPYGDNAQPMGTPPHVAAAASGAVAAAGAARGAEYVSPWDVALTAGSAAGTGWVGGLVLGKTVGALAGLSPESQQGLRRLGLWGGLLSGAVHAVFGGR